MQPQQNNSLAYLLMIGITVVTFSSMLLCACGAGIGFVGGVVQAVMRQANQ